MHKFIPIMLLITGDSKMKSVKNVFSVLVMGSEVEATSGGLGSTPGQEPVSRKPRKLFGPAKPFFVNP